MGVRREGAAAEVSPDSGAIHGVLAQAERRVEEGFNP